MKKISLRRCMLYPLTLVGLFFVDSCNRPPPYEYVPQLNDVTRAMIFSTAELERKWDIHLENSALVSDPFIEGLSLDFISQEILDIANARTLVVDVVETILHHFNDNSYLSYQVARRPLSVLDLEIRIHFESFFIKYVDVKYTERVKIVNGLVYYYSATAFDREAEMWYHHVEPYETSYVIVQAKREAYMPYTDEFLKKKPSNINSFLRFDPIVTPIY